MKWMSLKLDLGSGIIVLSGHLSMLAKLDAELENVSIQTPKLPFSLWAHFSGQA